MTGSAPIPSEVYRGNAERILVVDGGIERFNTLDLIREIAPDHAEIVDDVYEAVAIVGLCRANEGVHTVLVPITIPDYAANRIVEAFRIVDGRVRLVLLVPAGRQDAIDTALAAGFDDAIEMPTTPSRLLEALGDRASSAETRPSGESSSQITEPAAEASIPSSVPTGSPRTPPAILEDEPDPPSTTPDPPIIKPVEENLGDVDLVESVMADDGTLRSMCLAMIRSHLGTQDVHLLEPEDGSEADPRSSMPILHRGRTMGRLASSSIGGEDLSRWAEWIGHWLALEHQVRSLEELCETDELTDAGNRRAFERILLETLDAARRERRIVTLMVFDIDNFKSYNDLYGHEAGDEVLCETVELLRATIRRGDHVFRIGGDEFVVIFSDTEGPRGEHSTPPESVEQIAHRFQAQVCNLRFPKLGVQAPGTLSISAGLATFPWDGHDGPSLLRHADQLALESKRSGKNAITFGPGARSRCRDDEPGHTNDKG
ncbi:MAG: GGDEF domain-containing protein [Phycisphaerales bacterium]|jgi:diguanylate cyclase (GGDEF)-like protein|nr:GGDEF domain-containing protein [Phycisphaerales bacterium]